MADLDANMERFTFEVEGLDEELRVVRFRGEEGVSRLFRFELTVATEAADLDFAKVLNQPALLTLEGGEEPRYVKGVVSRLEMGAPAGRFMLFDVTLVPDVWRLTLRRDCRIFQEMAVDKIVAAVLDAAGVPNDAFAFNLSGTHAERTYCVQYRESDWEFITRLLEEEGIFHFFEHTNTLCKLIMADDPASHPPIAGTVGLPFVPDAGQVKGGEHVTGFSYAEEVRPGKVALSDYNFVKPTLNMLSESGQDAFPELAVYDYPGEFDDPGVGKGLATRRLEALNAVRRVAKGTSDATRLVAGFQFELAEHPREALNATYTLTAVSQVGEQPQVLEEAAGEKGTSYLVRFEAVPADVPFRPLTRGPKPVVEGPQTAVVVGPEGEEIYTDEFGRVKVQFHWDRLGGKDENSSCWIRVGQVWAGAGWGGIHLPRVGQEVVVDFLEGDPDRPIITGRVYHGTNRPPYTLPDNKTISAIKSNSSTGGDGFNEIRFEDKKDEEQLFVHAQRNQDVRVLNERYEWVGVSRHLVVKQDKFEHVENNRNETVDNDHLEEVGNDYNRKVAGKEAVEVGDSLSLKVTGDVTHAFKANHSEEVGSNYYLKAMGIVIESSTGITLKCGGNSVVIDPSGVTIKGTMVTVDGSMVKVASGPGSPAKSGKAGSIVAPAKPEEAMEADVADPGKVEQIKSEQRKKKQGKYGKQEEKPHKKDEEKPSWVEIELADDDGNPVPGEKYKVTLPDGSVKTGTLDQNGFARVEGVDPGNCKVTFPNLDKDIWEKA
jgi:type VI secretion system secreted protein VgrG